MLCVKKNDNVHICVHKFVYMQRNGYICMKIIGKDRDMEILSVRDYRNNLAAYFDKAEDGERVLIRRKNTLYALVSVGVDDRPLSPQQQQRVDEVSESLRRSLQQVKQMEAGEMPVKSAISFIDEL